MALPAGDCGRPVADGRARSGDGLRWSRAGGRRGCTVDRCRDDGRPLPGPCSGDLRVVSAGTGSRRPAAPARRRDTASVRCCAARAGSAAADGPSANGAEAATLLAGNSRPFGAVGSSRQRSARHSRQGVRLELVGVGADNAGVALPDAKSAASASIGVAARSLGACHSWRHRCSAAALSALGSHRLDGDVVPRAGFLVVTRRQIGRPLLRVDREIGGHRAARFGVRRVEQGRRGRGQLVDLARWSRSEASWSSTWPRSAVSSCTAWSASATR